VNSLMEMETPATLLQNPASLFTLLVEDTGRESAAMLRALAMAKAAGMPLPEAPLATPSPMRTPQEAIQCTAVELVHAAEEAEKRKVAEAVADLDVVREISVLTAGYMGGGQDSNPSSEYDAAALSAAAAAVA
jgi:hypothetical protein